MANLRSLILGVLISRTAAPRGPTGSEMGGTKIARIGPDFRVGYRGAEPHQKGLNSWQMSVAAATSAALLVASGVEGRRPLVQRRP